jgi:recombinational DNA repair ATPase RecF
MKLLELQLLNFMPYGGEHRIAFPTDPSRNVMVLFGDNMRGKTSFLNAIRWGLFGYALGRHRNRLDLAQMINVDAVAQGDCGSRRTATNMTCAGPRHSKNWYHDHGHQATIASM